MAFCKKCGKPIIWEHEGVEPKKGWKPYNIEDLNGQGLRQCHFDTCNPNESYVKLSEKISKLKPKIEKIQIGEEEYL